MSCVACRGKQGRTQAKMLVKRYTGLSKLRVDNVTAVTAAYQLPTKKIDAKQSQ